MSIKFSDLAIGLYLQEFLARQWETFASPHQWRNTSKFIRQGNLNCLMIHSYNGFKFSLSSCMKMEVLCGPLQVIHSLKIKHSCVSQTVHHPGSLICPLLQTYWQETPTSYCWGSQGFTAPHDMILSLSVFSIHPLFTFHLLFNYLFAFFLSLSTYTFSIQVHTLLYEIHKPPLF